MFDMHYDLLTKIYMCYKKNDFTFIEGWIKNYNENNVKGLIANLSFESIPEMKEEYDVNYYDPNVSVVEMFLISTNILKKYIGSDIYVLTSIEGCDFLNSENDLEQLHKLGLNAIIPVWNNKSKFGSGIRSECGLTKLGEKLIKKAIELGIAIDLSHANEKTFYDIINIIKDYRKKGIYPIVYASHSNSRTLCNHARNLTDEQIKMLSSVDGMLGLFTNCSFIEKDSIDKVLNLIGTEQYSMYLNYLQEKYIEHILYAFKLVKDVNKLAVSTDDMKFSFGDICYQYSDVFDYCKINQELREKLKKYFNDEEINKIVFENAFNIYKSLTKEKIITKKRC